MAVIPIALTFDNNYAPQAGVFIQSLIDTKKPETNYVIHAFGDAVEAYERRQLFSIAKDVAGVELYYHAIDVGRYADSVDKDRHMTASTFFRLHLASILPQYDKCLYLDVDMICCEDLSDLFATDMDGYVFAAAPELNHMLGVVRGGWQRSYYIDQHGWPEEKFLNYRQAGVLVLNLDMIRRLNLEARFEEAAAKKYKLMDQDIINITVPSEQIRRLHMRWNFVSAYGRIMSNRDRFDEAFMAEFIEAFESPAIIHWAGSAKPWNSVQRGYDLHDRFWSVAIKTPWYSKLMLQCAAKIAEKELTGRLERLKAPVAVPSKQAARKGILSQLHSFLF